MWQRKLLILALGMNVACLDVGTAPAGKAPLASLQPLGEHLWVFHIAGGPYAAHIQLLAIGDRPDAHGRRVFRPIPSRAWDSTPTNDLAGFQATTDDSSGSNWTLQKGEEVLHLAYAIAGDTATGALTLADGTLYPTFGVRFDSAAVGLIAPALPRIANDSVPVVMIRLDDAELLLQRVDTGPDVRRQDRAQVLELAPHQLDPVDHVHRGVQVALETGEQLHLRLDLRLTPARVRIFPHDDWLALLLPADPELDGVGAWGHQHRHPADPGGQAPALGAEP